MSKLKIHDTGNNEELKIIINNNEQDLQYCVGYELERYSNKQNILKIIYEFNSQEIEIENESD